MTAIFTGLGAGFARGSAATLGSAGLLGSAASGRAGEQLMVNAATGNLVITRQDEFLVGRGPDLGISRTYNSLTQATDGDNGDQWQMGTVRRVLGLTGTLNSAGSTIKRQAGDGSVVTYKWGSRAGVSAYWTTEGDGAHDKLVHASGQWTWTDGSGQVTETYEASTGSSAVFRLKDHKDSVGNTLSFSYHSGTDRLYRVTTQNHGLTNGNVVEQSYVEYYWNGNNIEHVVTGYTDYGNVFDSADNVNRTLTRTRYAYDSNNRLKTVTVDLTPEDNSVADGRTFVTTYGYDGTSKRVTSVRTSVSADDVSDGSRIDVEYDVSGRVKKLTEHATATETRVTEFSYGPSYTDVTGPDGQITRLEYAGGNLAYHSIYDWSNNGVSREAAGSIDGDAAIKFTSVPGATFSSVGAQTAVAAGDTVTFAVSLQAVSGSATTQGLGLMGSSSGWAGASAARILSGPGTLTQLSGGHWQISGLSTSQATRVEITRTYTQAETAIAYGFIDELGNYGDGEQLILAGGHVTKVSNLAPGAIGSWDTNGVTQTAAGSIDGQSAVKFTSASGATFSSVAAQATVGAGDSLAFAISLQAVAGSATTQALGLYGASSGWTGGSSTAKILSGPGQLEQLSGGHWKITGLSSSQATRIEITRTFAQAETAIAYGFIDEIGNFGDGQQLVLAGGNLRRLPAVAVDGQLTTITAPPAYSGAAAQIQSFEYDAEGNLIRSIAPDSRITQYGHDAMGNVTLIDNPVGSDVSRSYDAANRLVLEQSYGSNEDSSNIVHDSRFAYGVTGLLRYRVSPDGRVTEYRYDSYGRLDYEIGYEDRYSGSAMSEGDLTGWRNQLTDKTKRAITTYGYDVRGNLAVTYEYVATDQDGDPLVSAGYVATVHTFDHAGRLLTTRKNGEHDATYVYDGLGRVVASSDPAGGVTTVFFNDAHTRTVMRLASGLTQTLTYNKAGDLISQIESAVGSQTANLAPDLLGWTVERGERQAAQEIIPGQPAYSYVTTSTQAAGVVYNGVGVSAGETVRFRIAMKGFGTTTSHRFGLQGTITGGGAGSVNGAQAIIVSGPGKLTSIQAQGSLWQIDGVSTTEVTIVEIVRTFETAETAQPLFYMGGASESPFGTRVILSAPSVIKTTIDATSGETSLAFTVETLNSFDQLGRLRISYDNFDSGNRSYFVYDRAGRKTAEVNHLGEMTEFFYDTANRLVGTARYYNLVSSSYLTDLQNANNTRTAAQIRPAAHAQDVREWNVYANGRLVRTVNGAGEVTAFEYDGMGRVVRTTSYANTISVAGFIGTPPTGTPQSDSAKDRVTRTFYDRDGNVRATLDGEGYLVENLYDGAGRKTGQVAYANQTNAADRASGTLTDLKNPTGFVTASDNRRTRFVYDGSGLLRYQLAEFTAASGPAANHVTGFVYNAAGKLIQTTEYYTPLSPGGYDYGTVAAAVAQIATHAENRTTGTTYDSAGRIESTVDAAGLATHYTYDAAGQLTKVRVGSGAAERITRNWYDARGHLRFSVDPEGYLRRYSYSAGGRLVAERTYATSVSTVTDATTIDDVAGAIQAAAGSHVERRFGYDNVGRLTHEYDATNNLTFHRYDGVGRLDRTYAADGTIDESLTEFDYDAAGRLTKAIAAADQTNAATSEIGYNAFGEQRLSIDPKLQQAELFYDRRGLVTEAKDADGKSVHYVYNAFGEAVKVTDARGNATYSYYDQLGRVKAIRDATDHVTETTYTRFGEIETVVRRYNAATNAAAIDTLPTVAGHATKDATTAFEYEKRGLVKKVTDAEGFFETFTYTIFGDRESVTGKSANALEVAGATTTYAYDRRGLLVSETLPAKTYLADGTEQSQTVVNTNAYDSRGNLEKKTEAFGLAEERVTEYRYDAAGRLWKTIGEARDVLSQTDHLTVTTGFTPTEELFYDARGNLTKILDAANNRTVFFYDDLDRKRVEIDALGTYTAYSYDANGNVAAIEVYADPLGTVPADGGALAEAPQPPGTVHRTTTFLYDALDRLKESSVAAVTTGYWDTSLTTPAWALQSGSLTTTYDYDAGGNVVRTTDPNLNATHAWYDKLGRKTAQLDAGGYLTTWTYDPDGNVEKEHRFSARYTGALALGDPAPTVAPDTANDRITEYAYDRVGNRLSETRKDVRVYDPAGSNGSPASTLTDATIEYTYNGLGQVLTRTEATLEAFTYTYDGTGRLITETRPAFADHTATTVTPQVDYAYDGLGNLVRTVAAGSSGTACARTTAYQYGAGGLLHAATDAEGNTHTYSYDKRGLAVRDQYARLHADDTSTTEAVLSKFDALGRWVEHTVATLSGGTWAKGDISATEYTAFGEIGRAGVNGLWQTENKYDAAGRLWASNAGGGVWSFFGYDANGNRTLAIASAGEAFTASTTFAQALAKVGQANVNATYTVYDARNLAVSVVEESRELSATSTQTLTTLRAYNAFGEVASETDALSNTTTYTYNTMGRMTRSESPPVWMVEEDGDGGWIRPAQDYYYDKSGRLVATRDANAPDGTYTLGATAATAGAKGADKGNLTRLELLAGTGYGGGQALVTKEIHADTAETRTAYDIHGDARVLRDELDRTTTQTFDKLGRVTAVIHPGSGSNVLTDYYSYDLAGRQLKHWNSFYGSTNAETTDYDLAGRVTSARAFGGDITTTSYAWDAAIGAVGGWTETTTMANGRVAVEKADVFGRVRYKDDLDNVLNGGVGRVYGYVYDAAGRLGSVTQGSATQTYQYFNTGKLKSIAIANAGGGSTPTTTYGYDAAGNLTSQKTTDGGATTQELAANYDALGRMTEWTEAGNATTPWAHSEYSYDAKGNIRRVKTDHYYLDQQGAPTSWQAHPAIWYKYDSMDRVVLSGGTAIEYRADGQRAKVTTHSDGLTWTGWQLTTGNSTYYHDEKDTDLGHNWQAATTTYSGQVIETYSYDAAGRLDQVSVSEEQANANGVSTLVTPNGTMGASALRASFDYDAMGRLILQEDFGANGGGVQFSRALSYDAAGRLTIDDATTLRYVQSGTVTTSSLHRSRTTNSYLAGTSLVGTATTQAWKNGVDADAPDTSTTHTYEWRDAALLKTVSFDENTGSSSNTVWVTTNSYNAFAQLTGVGIQDGRPRTVTLKNSADGQAIRRDEADGNASTGDPHEVYYRMGGKHLGTVGNNGTGNVAYVESTAQRTRALDPWSSASGPFRGGASAGAAYADFGLGYEALNSFAQGGGGGSYQVQAGDTLQGIAQAIWGDAALWYKLAEANGLSAASALSAGRSLTIPTGVQRVHHNAGTFKPYDPAEIVGDTSPTTPKPAKGNKCGAFGQIMLAVVAVAVAVATSGALAAASLSAAGGGSVGLGAGISAAFGGTFTVAAGTGATLAVGTGISFTAGGLAALGAAGAAAGSIVSQGAGVATGLQEKFSWKGVALAGISGGVGGGLGGIGAFDKLGLGGANALAAAGRGVIGNVANQGIALATGLQNKFDFVGVAAAGVGAGVGFKAGKLLGAKSFQETRSFGNVAANALTGSARAIANAATRSAISGTSFGDNVMRALPDALGQTIGELVAAELQGPSFVGRINRVRYDSNLSQAGKIAGVREVQIGEAVSQVEAALGRQAGEQFRRMVAEKPALGVAFDLASEAWVRGYDSIEGDALLGAFVSSNRSREVTAGPGDLTVTGERTFGHVVAAVLVDVGELYTGLSPMEQTLIEIGAGVLKGGPVGAAAGYAIDKVVEQGLIAGGFVDDISLAVAKAGGGGLSVLSRSDMSEEIATATNDPFEASNLVIAGSAILGLASLGELARRWFRAGSGPKWTPPDNFRMPSANNGRFVGDVGNSNFSLSDDAADAMGVPRGSSVPWRQGIPDFSRYVVPGPRGMRGAFDVEGLTGNHPADRARIIRYMASETGLSQRRITGWLSARDLQLHHAGGNRVQIVPYKIHRLGHSGGAQRLRGEN